MQNLIYTHITGWSTTQLRMGMCVYIALRIHVYYKQIYNPEKY